MGVMVSEVLRIAFCRGPRASKDTARRAAESIPVNDQLAIQAGYWRPQETRLARVRGPIMAVIKADLKVSTATLEAKIVRQ